LLLERKSLSLWKYTSQINVQRKCPDLQFLAAVGHIADCTIQAEGLVAIFFTLFGYVDTGFVDVEVTACSYVFTKWWVADRILLSVLNMFTYYIVEGNWEFFT